MSHGRRVPERGEVIALPYGSDKEPIWWVRAVTIRGTTAFMVIEHLLNQDIVCHLTLNLSAEDAT